MTPDKDTGHRPDTVRTAYSLEEASSLLGITPEAVRKRLNRKTLEGFKDEHKKWQVYLPDKEPDTVRTKADTVRTPSREIERMEAHIDDLQKQLREYKKLLERRDQALERSQYLLAMKEQRILELEAPKEQRQSWWWRIIRRE